jgi:hypothetical protein
MTTEELATKIYRHVLSLSTSGEHWDKWDDKREIENIKRLIDNHQSNQPTGDQPTAELDII